MDKKPQMTNAQRKCNWEMVTGWVSILIAVLALCLTLFEAREERRANRLAVTPYMSIYCDLSPKLDQAGVFLQNIGLGPAIIL